MNESLLDQGDQPSEGVEYPEYMPEKFRTGTVDEAWQKMADSYGSLARS